MEESLIIEDNLTLTLVFFITRLTYLLTYTIFLTFAFNSTEDFISSLNAQHAEWTLDIIQKTFNSTFAG